MVSSDCGLRGSGRWLPLLLRLLRCRRTRRPFCRCRAQRLQRIQVHGICQRYFVLSAGEWQERTARCKPQAPSFSHAWGAMSRLSELALLRVWSFAISRLLTMCRCTHRWCSRCFCAFEDPGGSVLGIISFWSGCPLD